MYSRAYSLYIRKMSGKCFCRCNILLLLKQLLFSTHTHPPTHTHTHYVCLYVCLSIFLSNVYILESQKISMHFFLMIFLYKCNVLLPLKHLSFSFVPRDSVSVFFVKLNLRSAGILKLKNVYECAQTSSCQCEKN